MKRNKIWFCLLIICDIFSLISLAKSSSSSSNSFLGIPPQDEDYFKADVIKCKNGSKKFTRAQLNDNFCDCPDGTDEPGTSACPQGKFYCHNVGHLPISLPSSRVNDGICDCCDGSDEYDGNVKCLNTCWEAGKVAWDKLQKKIVVYREGTVLRKKEIEQAKQAIVSDKEELSKLKNEEKTLKKLIKQLEVQKEQIEKAEEKERLEKEKEEKEKKHTEEKEEAGDQLKDGKKENSSSDDDKIGPLDESSEDKPEKDEYATMAEESWQDEPESSEGLSKEELGRLVASRWTGEKTGDNPEKVDAENSHEGDTETTESTNDKVDNDRNDKKLTAGNGITTSWFKKIKDSLQNILDLVNVSPPPVDKLDADRVRKEYDDASTRLVDVESRISSLTEKLKHDFGREKEFYRLYDQCFETKQDKYVYKVCPFKEATQEEGYSRTQLGDWDKFENSYRVMVFSNGQGCWNGPNRSLKVKLRCGLKTELADVDEPSRCEYSALMTTPILCLEEKLEEFKHKLEDMHKEQPAAHDEL